MNEFTLKRKSAMLKAVNDSATLQSFLSDVQSHLECYRQSKIDVSVDAHR